MKTLDSSRRYALVTAILIGLVATVAAPTLPAQESSTESGVAAPAAGPQAIENEPQYAPEVQSWWRVIGSTLKPRANDVNYSTNSSGGCVYVSSGNASTVWNTPLWIPDGANVQFLRIYVNDTSASDIMAWFTVYDLYGAIVQEWAASSSGTPGQEYFDSPAINHVINYGLYSYVVNMRPHGSGSTLQFCGARVFYSY